MKHEAGEAHFLTVAERKYGCREPAAAACKSLSQRTSRHGQIYQGETNGSIDSLVVYLKPYAQKEINSLAVGGLCLLCHVTRPPDARDDKARTGLLARCVCPCVCVRVWGGRGGASGLSLMGVEGKGGKG